MKISRLFLVFGLILGILLSSASVFASDQGKGQTGDFASERILVKFKAGTSEAAKHQFHRAQGAAVIGQLEQIGVHILKIPAGKVPEKVLAYRNNPAVAYAEPDYIATAFVEVIDPDLDKQWGILKIQAPEAWDVSTGQDIKIAILDTGVDQNHEDLAGKIIENADFTGSTSVDDRYGHGTHVAGIAAAVTNNALGVAGVGYNCGILNGKVLADDGSGAYSWIASGIIWATDKGAKVINMSLGGRLGSYALLEAVNYAWNHGVVVVAAAGNNGTSKANYPAYYTNCIAVAATDSSDAKASFSNYGSWVDVAAPGVNIYSTMPNHSNAIGLTNYGSLSGTSMATPFVAGLAGLVWATSYRTSAASVRDRIESTAEQAESIWSAYGIERINAYQAVLGPAVNTAPVVTISSPIKDANFTAGIPINFAGSAADAEEGDLSANLVWTSDLDGKIGIGSSFSTTLSTGTHLITATATDSQGATDTASVTINVSATSQKTIEVGDFTESIVWINRVTWQAKVIVLVDPVLNEVVVTGDWSNGTTCTSLMTDSEGKCTFTSPNLNKKLNSVTFTVTNISYPDYTFVPQDGVSITIHMQ